MITEKKTPSVQNSHATSISSTKLSLYSIRIYKNFPFVIVIKEQELGNLNYSLLSFSMTKKKKKNRGGKALVSIKELQK